MSPGSSSGNALGYGLHVGDGEGWNFFSLLCLQIGPGVKSASCKISIGPFKWVKAAKRRAATLSLPNAVAANMWALTSTYPWTVP